MWECKMYDTKNKKTISIGKMFFVDTPMGLDKDKCRFLGRHQNPPKVGLASYTFMEYFSQPRSYTTAATWTGFQAVDKSTPGSKPIRPVGIARECCDRGDLVHGDIVNGSSSTCLPPECDSPAIHFSMGPYLQVPAHVMEQNPGCFK
jgi:hypothetical protein